MQYSKQISILLTSFSTLIFAAASYAATSPASYLGIQLGQGDTHYSISNQRSVNSAKISDEKLASRIFVGYQFNSNFAAELGYSHFGHTDYAHINGSSNSGAIKEYAYDLIGKAILPLPRGLGLYGKAGIANVHATTSGALSGSHATIQATYGLGGYVDINPDLPIDIAWTRINSSKNIPKADLITVGISYYID